MNGACLATWLLSTVALRGDVPPQAQASADEVFMGLDGPAAAGAESVTLTLVREPGLPGLREGASSPGVIHWSEGALDLARVLRHELAHQWVWWRCPAAGDDRLFHEALAMGVAGEVKVAVGEALPTLLSARQRLQAGVALDSRAGRSALRRVLLEWPGRLLPRAVERKLKSCASHARWQALSLDDLLPNDETVSLFVLWDRTARRAVAESGPVHQAFAAGSTLKPFVVAGQPVAPPLAAHRGRGEWQCGMPSLRRFDAASALARSCNGYFLDWEQTLGHPLDFGAATPWLVQAGLVGEARSVRDAIGFTHAVTISAHGLARAYDHMLGERPDMFDKLSHVFADGTLRGSHPGPLFRAGKSGTVRDAYGSTALGWVVLVGPRWIAVRAESGVRPVKLVDATVEKVERMVRRLADRGPKRCLNPCRGAASKTSSEQREN